MNSFIETLNQWGGQFLSFAWPMLWQSSLLILVLFALGLLLRRRVRASVCYALWLVVLVKLCLPPTLALPTSPAWWLHKAQPPVAPQVHYTVTYGAQPLPEMSQPPAPVYIPPKPVMTSAAWWLLVAGFISILLLTLLITRWRQIARRVRSSRHSERLTAILNESRHLAGVKSIVAVKLTGNTMSPAVCGLFHPVILIPDSLAEGFSDEQLRSVLLHELIHLRRRDVWLNFWQALLQIIYWWHPLFWLANARIRRVREEAVDDAVMLALRDKAEAYAPTLLAVAKLALKRPLASLGLVSILESRSALRQRIERLVNFRPPRKAGVTLISLLGIAVFTLVAVPMGGAPAQLSNTIKSDVDGGRNQAGLTGSAAGSPSNSRNGVEENMKVNRLVQDGKLLYEMGKLTEAEKLLKSALELDSENGAAKYYLELVQGMRQSPQLTQTVPVRKEIVAKLKQIRLDRFGPFDGVSLDQVVRNLSDATRQEGIRLTVASGSNSGLAAIIDPATGITVKQTVPAVADTKPVTVHLFPAMENVSLLNALKAIISGASRPIKFSIQAHGIVFSEGASDAALLFSRTFKVDTNIFLAHLKEQTDVQTNIAAALRRLFSNAGVELKSPKAVSYNERLGMVFVRATEHDLDAIENIVMRLNNNKAAPQIHVRARFIEVPKGDLAGLEKLIGITNKSGQIVGILPGQNAVAALRTLQSRSDVKELAAPEVTTRSGRQTEMRATTRITIITNFSFQETSAGRAVFPQTNAVETGPVLDIIPFVLADDHTINLTAIASVTKFLGYDKTTNMIAAHNQTGQTVDLPTILPSVDVRKVGVHVKLWDGQTLVLSLKNHFYDAGKEMAAEPDYFVKTARTRGQPNAEDEDVLVFITATLVDPAGNRIHSEDQMPFAKDSIPAQDSP